MDINLGNLYYLVTQRGADEVENKLKKLETKFKSFGKGQNKASDPFTAINTGAKKSDDRVKLLNAEIKELIDGAQATRNAWQAELIDGDQAKRELQKVNEEALALRATLQSTGELNNNLDRRITQSVASTRRTIGVIDDRPARGGFADGVTQGINQANLQAKAFTANLAADLASDAIRSVFTGVKNNIEDATSATREFQAQLGVTEERSKELRDVAVDVFGNAFGSSLREVTNSLIIVSQQFKDLNDNELQDFTENALTITDTFGSDFRQTVSSAKTLMEQFGLSSDEAFDFIAAGFQGGLDRSGDFLDTINEYSVQFAQSELSASEFFSAIETGAQGGNLGTDRVADLFKEFRVRITDESVAVNKALEQLGVNTDLIFGDLENAPLSVADSFDLITQKLSEVGNSSEANRLAVALFGTQLEDLGGPEVLASIDLTNTTLKDLEGTTDRIAEAKYTNLSTAFTELFRGITANQNVIDSIAVVETFLAGIVSSESVSTTAINSITSSLSGFLALGEGASSGISVISDVFDKIFSNGQLDTTGLDSAQASFLEMNASVNEVNGGLSLFRTTINDFLTENSSNFEAIKTGYQDYFAAISGGVLNLVDIVFPSLTTANEDSKTSIELAFAVMTSTANLFFDGFATSITFLTDTVIPLVQAGFTGIKTTAELVFPIISQIVEDAKLVWVSLQPAFSETVTLISGLFDTDLRVASENFGLILGNLAGLATNALLGIGVAIFNNREPLIQAIKDVAVGVAVGFVAGVNSQGEATIAAIDLFIKNNITDPIKAIPAEFVQAGKDIVAGLMEGFNSQVEVLGSSVSNIASTVEDTFKNFLRIRSPSEVFIEAAQDILNGLVIGLNDDKIVRDSLTALGNTIKGFVSGFDLGFIDASSFRASLEEVKATLTDDASALFNSKQFDDKAFQGIVKQIETINRELAALDKASADANANTLQAAQDEIDARQAAADAARQRELDTAKDFFDETKKEYRNLKDELELLDEAQLKTKLNFFDDEKARLEAMGDDYFDELVLIEGYYRTTQAQIEKVQKEANDAELLRIKNETAARELARKQYLDGVREQLKDAQFLYRANGENDVDNLSDAGLQSRLSGLALEENRLTELVNAGFKEYRDQLKLTEKLYAETQNEIERRAEVTADNLIAENQRIANERLAQIKTELEEERLEYSNYSDKLKILIEDRNTAQLTASLTRLETEKDRLKTLGLSHKDEFIFIEGLWLDTQKALTQIAEDEADEQEKNRKLALEDKNAQEKKALEDSVADQLLIFEGFGDSIEELNQAQLLLDKQFLEQELLRVQGLGDGYADVVARIKTLLGEVQTEYQKQVAAIQVGVDGLKSSLDEANELVRQINLSDSEFEIESARSPFESRIQALTKESELLKTSLIGADTTTKAYQDATGELIRLETTLAILRAEANGAEADVIQARVQARQAEISAIQRQNLQNIVGINPLSGVNQFGSDSFISKEESERLRIALGRVQAEKEAAQQIVIQKINEDEAIKILDNRLVREAELLQLKKEQAQVDSIAQQNVLAGTFSNALAGVNQFGDPESFTSGSLREDLLENLKLEQESIRLKAIGREAERLGIEQARERLDLIQQQRAGELIGESPLAGINQFDAEAFSTGNLRAELAEVQKLKRNEIALQAKLNSAIERGKQKEAERLAILRQQSLGETFSNGLAGVNQFGGSDSFSSQAEIEQLRNQIIESRGIGAASFNPASFLANQLFGQDDFTGDLGDLVNNFTGQIESFVSTFNTVLGGVDSISGAVFGDDATGNGNEIISGLADISSAFGPWGQAVSTVLNSVNAVIGDLGNGLREIELEVRDLATGFSFFSEDDIAEALKPAQERISRGGFLGFLGFTKAGLNETEKNLILDNLREIEGVIQGAVDSLDLSSIIPDINAIVGKSLIDGVIESSQIAILSEQYKAALEAENTELAADLSDKLETEISLTQLKVDEIAKTYAEPILDGSLSQALGSSDNFKDFKQNYRQSVVDATKQGLIEALQTTAAFQIIEKDLKAAFEAAAEDRVITKSESENINDIVQRGIDFIEDSGVFESFDLLDKSIGKTNEAFDELTATVINGPANFDLNNYVDPFYASRPQSSSRTENYNITVDGRTLTRAEIVDIVRESNNQTARREGSGINPVY